METWSEAKKRLVEEYREAGIMSCEGRVLNPKCCGWGLSFHHLDRRSSGKSKDTFEGTRLLCVDCHHRADNAPGYKEFNEKLRELR
jgi:hypothetical protein